VIARPAFTVDLERLSLDAANPWPIEGEPLETEHGTFPADTPFLSGGVDLFVMGSAYAPNGNPASEVRVDIRAGSRFTRSIRVVGDRVWRAVAGTGDKAPLALEASPPTPFVSMPLSYDRAFGGTAAAEGYEYSYPPNPAGRGLYASAEAALDRPLPNLEDYDNPVRSIEDRPEPVGTAPYPTDGSLRPLSALDLHVDLVNSENTRIERITPRFFNAAHPRMVIPPEHAPAPGQLIEVTSVRPGGAPFRFGLPDMAMHVHVQLEDRQYLFPLHLDQIGMLPDENRVFLSFRTVFTYRMVPHERRRVTLHRGPAPDAIPESYTARWEDGS